MANNTYATNHVKIGSINDIPSTLQPSSMLDDDIFHARGIYGKREIETARFSNFSRFGRILDPYGRLNDGREYLFFVKPDLHICVPNGLTANDVYNLSGGSFQSPVNGLILNPQLSTNGYFIDLVDKHPEVIKELQTGVDSTSASHTPFSYLLSHCINGYLDMPSSEASTLDNPATILGTNYEYLKDAMESDENPNFTLDFLDSKNLDCYHFFKAYAEYHKERKSGLVTPPDMSYYRYKRLHNTMGIYKFIVDEDMETIIYYAYLYGVYPLTFPREAFGDPLFSDGLTFSVNFKAAFIEDSDPRILRMFNDLMLPVLNKNGVGKNEWLPVTRQNHSPDMLYGTNHSYDTTMLKAGGEEKIGDTPYSVGSTSLIDGTLPFAALVDGRVINGEKPKYRLRWYARKTTTT
jgi:hypothetical protein